MYVANSEFKGNKANAGSAIITVSQNGLILDNNEFEDNQPKNKEIVAMQLR
jgi:hypothetical protein